MEEAKLIPLVDFMVDGRSLLEVKFHLNKHKRHGILFYRDADLSLKQPEDEIELYNAVEPYRSYYHAFPVAIGLYVYHKQTNTLSVSFLREQFEMYYNTSSEAFSDKFFEDLQIFQAQVYVWFFCRVD
ncbi:hypothetical protein [Alicyclobacillus dauci]|uniref:PD-(D/E)XK nuclease superfamily protein n=1 Tax=Alicyclobacillus dauci TaxID=1475485 RepID=A0ABY6Z7M9_9BACL|nr:hypothetical protein [Alicyclobacillus dauci]WAH38896.1 hypothetical protein NZD86_10655 [Alicyclobacillus dauci]